MQYNYSFEIAAAIIMFLLLAVHLMNPAFELVKSRSYFSFLVAAMIETISNILSSWGLANTDIVSNTANKWICFIFFLSEAFVSILFFRYVVNLCVSSRKIRTIYAKLTLIPFGFFLAMLFTNDFFHLIYKLEDNVYTQGKMAWYGYTYIEFFILASFLVSFFARNTIRGRSRYAVMLATFISVMGIIIQYNIKSVLLTGFSNAIVLCMFFILIQNPMEFKDKISGARNNRAFFLRYENSVNQEKPIKVLTVDIHQPLQLNVLYGYKNGNTVLAEVGEFLSALAGVSNTFQISGNVFALIIEKESDVERIRDEVEKRFAETWNVDNLNVTVPVKLAYIRYPEDVTSTKEFFGIQNFAKDILRSESSIRYLEITPEIKASYDRDSKVDEALKRALENRSLQVYFQPIFSNKAGAFNSLEALARIIDEKIGFIPPDEFIERAENTGLVITLDMMILEKTCEFIADNIIPNLDRLSIETVHINISALQCMQLDMDKKILEIIDKYKVPRNMIVLELTERAAVSAAKLMEKHMISLKDSGVRFALDDYGTGNSNCSYLIEYPFDKVKFDKNMVWAYFKNETGRIILDGEMKTIHNLNIPIVAEGIETEEQIEAMKALNVEAIQGYFYSKPLPPQELMDFLFEKSIENI